MKENFWEQLPKPFFALAPLYDVTDCAFREMIARRKTPPSLPLEGEGGSDPLSLPLLGGGPPQVMFTEFVSVDGLCHEKSRDKSLGSARDKLIKLHLGYTENQRPIVAQLWGSDPEKFKVAAEIVRELGFDGIDINMGCPDKKVVMMGAGAGLIKNPKLAQEIIYATQAAGLPVSVKTRTGYSQRELDTWIPALLETKLAALTIHARTMKEMSKVPANWEDVKKVVEIRNDYFSTNSDVIPAKAGIQVNLGPGSRLGGRDDKIRTLVVGNGDVRSMAEARARVEETECDGVMIGRGIFGNYDLFLEDTNNTNGDATNNTNTDTNELINNRLRMVVEHAELFEKYYGSTNLTQDHLDFHGDMESYFQAKALLFTPEFTESAVVNIDDPHGLRLFNEAKVPTKSLSRSGHNADWYFDSFTFSSAGNGYEVAIRGSGGILIEGFLPLLGLHNLDNALLAIALAVESGVDPIALAYYMRRLSAPVGRLEPVEVGQKFLALVDYAHTPDAVSRALSTARTLTSGRVIAVLGCGGDRDKSKRPIMGRALREGADLAVFTSDNPRSEDPELILNEMVDGVESEKQIIEPDRRAAIATAVLEAEPGDCVIVLGKGHERGQEISGVKHPFDDRIELARAIEELS